VAAWGRLCPSRWKSTRTSAVRIVLVVHHHAGGLSCHKTTLLLPAECHWLPEEDLFSFFPLLFFRILEGSSGSMDVDEPPRTNTYGDSHLMCMTRSCGRKGRVKIPKVHETVALARRFCFGHWTKRGSPRHACVDGLHASGTMTDAFGRLTRESLSAEVIYM
jgi:hypothetical protein